MDDGFLEIAVPERTTLLGLELKPLTIGHCLLLDRFDCVNVQDPDSLVMAVLICSDDHEKFQSVIESRWLDWQLKIWRWRLGKVDWLEKIQLWHEYFDGQSKPPLTVSLQDGKGMAGSGTPFMQHLKTYLQAKLNYSPSEALNAQVGMALWDYYSHAEIEGNIRVVDREEVKDAQQWLADNEADILKQAEQIQEEARRKAANGA